MARAADGTMTLSGTFAIANTIPVSTTINGYIADIVTELTDSWSRSGKGAALAHLSMGSFKLTTMADGVALTDAATVKQVQNATVAWADGGGTADAITATYSPAVTAVVEGMRLRVRATAANATTTPTFAPNGLTARTIKKLNGQALVAGDIAGDEHDLDLTYVATGTYWNLNNPASIGAASATSLTVSQNFALSGDISPPQITADQNDYAPTGHATASVIRISTDQNDRNITGLAGGADGRIVLILNIGSFRFFLTHDDGATSTAANRFLTADNGYAQIPQNGAALLVYDATSARWRVHVTATIRAPQSVMEAATSQLQYVVPGFQQNHPGHPKFWAYVTVSGGTPTLQTSYNVTSITDTGVGVLTVTIATDFSDANWSPHVSFLPSATDNTISYSGIAAGTIVVRAVNSGNTAADPTSWSVMGLGDQ
jgi:hypothetical protein